MNPAVGGDLHYLESLDSVRPPSADARVQIFSEVLMSLVLGRDVVVPQSFAFDSSGFHQVAQTFLAARDAAGVPDQKPFRLHLFGAGVDTFDDAVGAMLARVTDPQRPFVSSAFPELHEDPGAISSAGALLNSSWLDDSRAAAFEAVLREFQRTRRAPARPHPRSASLPELLRSFVDPAHPAESEVHERLVAAVRSLNPEQAGLDVRSSLRVDAPWPGDPDGRPPAAIVGGPDRLDEVIEFVDTLYNAVVAGSIGTAATTFSTGLETGDDRLAVRRLAQHQAITQYRAGPGADADAGSMFEVREAPAPGILGDLLESARDGLPALFRERADSTSRFATGLAKLRRAQEAGDARAATRELERHVGHAARILGQDLRVQRRGETALRLGIGLSLVGATTMATSFWAVPPAWQALMAGVEFTAAESPVAARYVSAWRAGRRRAAAMLEIVRS